MYKKPLRLLFLYLMFEWTKGLDYLVANMGWGIEHLTVLKNHPTIKKNQATSQRPILGQTWKGNWLSHPVSTVTNTLHCSVIEDSSISQHVKAWNGPTKDRRPMKKIQCSWQMFWMALSLLLPSTWSAGWPPRWRRFDVLCNWGSLQQHPVMTTLDGAWIHKWDNLDKLGIAQMSTIPAFLCGKRQIYLGYQTTWMAKTHCAERQ